MIRWLTVFLDLPTERFGPDVGFWAAITGSTVSASRGDHDEFATLQPGAGTAVLKVQRVGDEPPRLHLDLHVDDVAATAERAAALGATIVELGEWAVLSSPAGFVHCLVSHLEGTDRPGPVTLPDGGVSRLGQLAIDIPAEHFAAEVAYWGAVTGWEARSSPLHPEFTIIDPPAGLPIGLLLQRLGDEDGRALAGAHLDVAAGDDRERLAAAHERLGAQRMHTAPDWITLADPAGLLYCLTAVEPVANR